MHLICYDISDNRRRYRVDKLLSGYGVRVQKSVFECYLRQVDKHKLEQELHQLIADEEDSIRIYSLCGKDRKRISIDGIGMVSENWEFLLI